MSYLKFAQDLFLEKQELDRLKRFVDDDGFRNFLLMNTIKFGVINNEIADDDFSYSKVTAGSQTVPNPTIKVSEVRAIDGDGNFIWKEEEDNITIPTNDEWYWVRITHVYNTQEEGEISINTSGVMSGTSTKFEEVLRGQPNFPAKIKLHGSLNTGEYEVLEVTSNTSALLQGEFQNESDIKYSVVGTFTPGHIPTSGDKYPFQYDYCTLELVLETVTNTKPSFTQDYQFYLARIKRDGTSLEIQDKRDEIWETKSDFLIRGVEQAENVLIGVEAIKFDQDKATKEKNIVYLSWSFRSSNFTIDSKQYLLTLNSGEGGKFKATTDFTNGDFDGWRVYTADGNYVRVKQSTLSGSQINLTLDTLIPDSFNATTEVIVAPDAEEIEIICDSISNLKDLDVDTIEWQSGNTIRYTFNGNPNLSTVKVGEDFIFTNATNVSNNGTFAITAIDNTTKYIDITNLSRSDATDDESSDSPCVGNPKPIELPTERFLFPINLQYGKFRLLAYINSLCYFSIKYRYKNLNNYAEEFIIPSDPQGFYAENQWDSNGDLIGSPSRTAYVTDPDKGFIPLNMKPDSYSNVIAPDTFGFATRALSNVSPVVELEVGVDAKYQLITGSPITLTVDHYINLKTDSAEEGTVFIIILRQAFDKSTYDFKIVQDYVSPSIAGTLIKDLSEYDVSTINNLYGLQMRAMFDGTNWQLTGYNELLAGFYGASAFGNFSVEQADDNDFTDAELIP